jgi:hypothetical protein
MMLVAILALALAAVPAIAQVSGGSGNPAQGNVMQPGEVLNPDQSITSADGRYNFVYQGDGNLVPYDAGGTPMWSSGTNGTPVGVRHAGRRQPGHLRPR